MNTTVYLALRKSNPPTFMAGLFSKITKYRLVTKYPHAGIVIDGVLFHSTLDRGVHCTDFNPEGWDTFKIDISSDLIKKRFNYVKGAHYDWISLFTFILPFKISVGKWLYCFELVWFLITNEFPSERITPESLLALTHGGANG